MPCIGQDHGDAAAHRARAHDCRSVHGNERSVFRDVGNFGDFAFAEENMNEGFRLIGEEAIHEELALEFAAFVERELCGGFDGIDGGEWREHAALFFTRVFACCRKDWSVLIGRAELVAALSRFANGLVRDFASKCNCAGSRSPSIETVNDPKLLCFRSFDRIAIRAHFDRFGSACEPRQTLRAGRAGDDAKLHFRLADLRAGHSDAVVAGHGEFEAAAEGAAVNGHDDGLAAVFDFQRAEMAVPIRRRHLPEVILPNSLMSAPATNVLPPPIRTAALTEVSPSMCWIASAMPSGTPGLSAFTGGLLMVMTAMPLSLVS